MIIQNFDKDKDNRGEVGYGGIRKFVNRET
jgi:hypothetical protein